LVIDASVALKWFLPNEPDAGIALGIVREGGFLIAPDLVIAEVCNAAWKSARLGLITGIQVSEIAAELSRFFGAIVATAPLAHRAVAIAGQLDHPVYDALYIALAERDNAQLITADSRLVGKVSGTAWESRTTLLGRYKPVLQSGP
jgi:predicted nucleic acid-binding protein